MENSHNTGNVLEQIIILRNSVKERLLFFFFFFSPQLLLLQYRLSGAITEMYVAKHGKSSVWMCLAFSVGRKYIISV